jgi:hypothetical protein
LLVDRLDAVRFGQAKFLETSLERYSVLEQQRPDRPISAEDARFKFVEEIHAESDARAAAPVIRADK